MASNKWDKRYLELASFIASWSKDPSTKVGAVIVRPDKSICSVGFNGFPAGIRDHEHLLKDKEEKLARMVHAEMNAILYSKEVVRGYAMYSTHPPCERCAAHIIQVGLGSVYWYEPNEKFKKRWGESLTRSRGMLYEARVGYMGVTR